ncbi:MAG: DeoR/GlpR family DNA-binding transcription regulator [Spirochaetia bacterium]|jgi:DeoR/GlpR family transcriptional regulator of sugar metabolism
MSVTNALRREKIREYLLLNGKAEVKDLGPYLNASDATIRRDLLALLKESGFKRIRGGVSLDETNSELSVAQRGYLEADKKRRIGKKAAELVRDGEVIFLGTGSTVIEVAKNLAERKNLTVITNSLPIVNILVDNPGIDLVMTGGALRRPELSFIGHIVEKALSELRADKVIIGIQGIHPERGLTNEFLPEAILDRVLVHFAPQLIIVADSSKLGKIKASFVGSIEDVGTLVTDSTIDKTILSDLERHGVHVMVAD